MKLPRDVDGPQPRRFIIFLLLFCSVLPSWADLNNTQLRSVLAEQFEVLQEIHSIDYTITRELGNNSPYRATTHWWELDNQYKYDFQFAPTSKAASHIATLVSKSEDGHLDGIINEMSLFTPFEFILTRNSNITNWIPRLRDLHDPDLLSFVKTIRLDLEEVSIANHPCIAASFPGGKERYMKIPVTYRVFFAKDLDFYPIGWDQQNSAHQTIVSYRVNEVQTIDVNGLKFRYPAKAKIDYFSYDPSKVFSQPVNSGMGLTVEDVRLNQLSDSDF